MCPPPQLSYRFWFCVYVKNMAIQPFSEVEFNATIFALEVSFFLVFLVPFHMTKFIEEM